MLLQLAWKNIWRNKRRSLILILSAIVGIWGGVASNGIVIGMWETTIEAAINRELSHIQIHHPKFRDEKLLSQNIPRINEVREILKQAPFIKNYCERLIIEGMASSPVSAGGVRIFAIDPSKEKEMTSISQKVIAGTYFGRLKNNEILIGNRLAEKLKLKLNSKVILSFQDLQNNLVSSAFRVSGIYKTESLNYDGITVFVKKDDIATLLGTDTLVHEVAIRVANVAHIDTLRNYLKSKIDFAKVEDWKEIAPEFALVQGILYLELNIFIGIILFALLFGISNTIMMSVFERIREFGVLMAVGMKRIRLFMMIIMESVFLLFTGGTIGTLIGYLTIEFYSKRGIDLSILEEGMAAYGMPAILYPTLPWHMYVSLFLMMLVTAFIAAVSPAIKATRLKPAEAIRMY
ncbi:MAG: FtsX-like permease family protein [Bacteroidetes bacterium]|nr:FtsX-like permease family protein [Bacteroidota bacterium]